jgi:hypothetical protein
MQRSRNACVAFGVGNLLTALLVAIGIFAGLPSRWAPVDVAAGAVVATQAAAGAALILRARWAERMARVAASLALALGLFAVSMLAITASWLYGVYGPVGRGGSLVMILVLAMLLPYAGALPIGQLLWLRRRSGSAPASSSASASASASEAPSPAKAGPEP